jgi:Inner membrane component of T3SS, cytoplasmic domain
MSELTLNVVRLGLLALLWAFVFSVVGALRADLWGTRVLTRGGGRRDTRPARPPRGRRGPSHLAVVAGSLRGTTVPLHESGLLIGRNPECSLVLTDDFASGRHLRVVPGPDGDWYAEDLGSTNGTFVNNRRISEPTRLGPGAQIRVGQTVLELQR